MTKPQNRAAVDIDASAWQWADGSMVGNGSHFSIQAVGAQHGSLPWQGSDWPCHSSPLTLDPRPSFLNQPELGVRVWLHLFWLQWNTWGCALLLQISGVSHTFLLKKGWLLPIKFWLLFLRSLPCLSLELNCGILLLSLYFPTITVEPAQVQWPLSHCGEEDRGNKEEFQSLPCPNVVAVAPAFTPPR